MKALEPDRQDAPEAGAPRLLTVEDLGRMLSIGPRGARKMLERGEIPSLRLGRRLYVRPADLEAHLAALVEREKAKRSPEAARILRGLGRRKV